MTRAFLATKTDVAWPGREDIVLVLTQAERYSTALPEVLRVLGASVGQGVVVTANRPLRILRDALDAAKVDRTGFRFVDCISGMTGILPQNEPDAVYIESPTLLEKVGLRAEQLLRRMPEGPRFLFLDSLSTLAVYNGVEAVSEMVHNLTTRLRLMHAGAALLLVHNPGDAELRDAVQAHCDHVVEA